MTLSAPSSAIPLTQIGAKGYQPRNCEFCVFHESVKATDIFFVWRALKQGMLLELVTEISK